MTLALYGKTNKRRGILILAALFAVAFAVLGGVAARETAKADDTTFKAATDNDGGTCTNVNRAQSGVAGYTTCTDGQTAIYKTFALGIPAGAVIQGIEVKLSHSTLDNNGNNPDDGVNVAVDNGGGFSSNELLETDTEGTPPSDSDTAGGTSDLWGLTWTAAGANAIRVRVTGFTVDSGSQAAYFDDVQVRATYIVPGPISGDGITPVFVAGASNTGKTCADLAPGTIEFKLEGGALSNGPHTSGSLTVTLASLTSDTFNWSSNLGIDAVIVKGGSNGTNLYTYAPEDTADTGLGVPNASNNSISHISFCWDSDQTAPKLKVVKRVVDHNGVDVDDPTNFSFSIDRLGENETGVSPTSFNLDDDSNGALSNEQVVTLPAVSGSDDTYEIDEDSVSGWTLDSITCTGALATIDPDTIDGDIEVKVDNTSDVTCTFVNKKDPPPTRTLKICKQVIDNGVAPTNQGGPFTITIEGEDPFTPTVDENDTGSNNPECTTREVYEGDVDINETVFPSGWTSASGWPKYNLDGGSFSSLGSGITLTIGNDTCSTNGAQPSSPVNTVKTGTSEPDCIVIIQNKAFADGHIIIRKMGNVANTTQTFGGTIDGSTPWSVTGVYPNAGATTSTFDVTAAAHTVREDPGTNGAWSLYGYAVVAITAPCPTSESSYTPSASGQSVTVAAGETKMVCVLNQTREITITKIAVGGDDTFGGTISNDGTFSLTTSGGTATQDYSVTTSQTHQVVETPVPANWILDGYKTLPGLHANCSADTSKSYTSNDNVVPADGLPYTVCIKNHAVGKIRIVKNDLTLPGDGTRPASWGFTVAGPAGATPAIPLGGGSVDVLDRPFGTYAVTEDASHTLAACPALPNTTQQGYYTTASIPADTTISTPGEMLTWTFTNTPCPSVQAAPNLSVRKIIDFNGNGVNDGDDYFDNGWAITVTCGAVVMNGTTGANGLGNVSFLGTPNGNCTVAETTQAGYNSTVKFTRIDGGVTSSGPGWQLPITQDNNENNLVDFYNQPLVNIHVHKDIVTAGGVKSNGNGWTFTLTGCGITPQVKTTASSGNVDFTDLPPAKGCSYTVTETTQGGWIVSPGATQNAAPTAGGETANLTFTNTQVETCGAECLRRPPETPTVPPPPPPPPPPEVTQVAGERTPGVVSTPIAPSTGTGTTGGGAPATIVLALAGVAMAGSAFAITIFARKPRR